MTTTAAKEVDLTSPLSSNIEASPDAVQHIQDKLHTINQLNQFKVIKRAGNTTDFNVRKIETAVTHAFVSVEGSGAADSERVSVWATEVALKVFELFIERREAGSVIHIEDIQDKVELILMREYPEVAKSYILYRERRAQAREVSQTLDTSSEPTETTIQVEQFGQHISVTQTWLQQHIKLVCQGLTDIDTHAIASEAFKTIYDGVTGEEFSQALVLSARAMIERDPAYGFAAARLLRFSLLQETADHFNIQWDGSIDLINALYTAAFEKLITQGIQYELIDPNMKDFDLKQLADALVPARDEQLHYLGMQTLYDRYFLHQNGTRIELPQTFFMRVAMGLSLAEGEQKTARAIEFYHLISKLDYMCSTPTLFNAGTLKSQLSSCFLTTIPDSLAGIYSSIKDNAMLSKFAGGIGNDWTPVRSIGATIKGTNGKSLGVVPFMNVADATAIAVNQGGKRKGAVCGYLETWHLDIEEFIELRKNTGDDRRRTHDMNTANWIPDLFMQRVMERQQWTLFSPNDVPDLHDLYGSEFEVAYTKYEKLAAEGKINHKQVSAVGLWRKMLGMLFETGHPWMTWKDPCNLRSPQQHIGVVHSSNLCTEITLNTNDKEIAVCNLGSINLPAHMKGKELDIEKLKCTIRTAVRMLDNVIDINYYTVPQAEHSNLQHRPVGLGVMGFQEALYQQGLAYASKEAIQFADTSMELISYYAIEASILLAQEKGRYKSYTGSLWDQGVLPIDSIERLKATRGTMFKQDQSMQLDWAPLRAQLKAHGMRNSNVLAIAPTATISNICGVSQSIEPTYQNLFVKSNMSGEFTVINQYLVAALKERDLWDESMLNDIKYENGSVQNIARIPDSLKALFATAFELDPECLVEAASRRQKWIDQAQSLNLYMAEPSGKKLDQLYKAAWCYGLKTTYYLRTLGISHAEKSTIHDRALNAVSNQETTVCNLDEGCEACQ